MMQFLQVNLRKMGTARGLLNQAAREVGADVLIISEKPRGPPDDKKSFSDLDSSAQLVLTNSAPAVAQHVVRGRYHVGALVGDVAVFSCYLPPSLTAGQFAEAIDKLRVDCSRVPRADLLVAGDFNAKVASWGSAVTDGKGEILAEFAAGLDLRIENVGNTPTFHTGSRHSVIDFT